MPARSRRFKVSTATRQRCDNSFRVISCDSPTSFFRMLAVYATCEGTVVRFRLNLAQVKCLPVASEACKPCMFQQLRILRLFELPTWVKPILKLFLGRRTL